MTLQSILAAAKAAYDSGEALTLITPAGEFIVTFKDVATLMPMSDTSATKPLDAAAYQEHGLALAIPAPHSVGYFEGLAP